MKKLLSAALAALFVCIAVAPAPAMDRVIWHYGQNPPTSWWNQWQRNERLGLGQFLFDAMGRATTPTYSNLTVQTSSGLNVVVGPANTNTLGSVYQYLADDTGTYGDGITALAADPHQIFVQGLMLATGPTIGPLNPPGTSGQSINYLIECKVNEVDQTSQTVTYVSSLGVVTSGSANRDRADTVTCQSKTGVAATTGSQVTPAVDAGWVGIGYVAVANGTATITTPMIFNGAAASTALAPWNGFVNLLPTVAVGTPQSTQTGSTSVSGSVSGNYGTLSVNGSQLALIPAAGMTSGGYISNAANTTPNLQWTDAGNFTARGNLQVNSTNTAAYVPPVYTNAGAATAGTEHIVRGTTSCTVTANVAVGAAACNATVNLTGSAQFATATSYQCLASLQPPGGALEVHCSTKGTTSFGLYVDGLGNNTSGTVNIDYYAIGQ